MKSSREIEEMTAEAVNNINIAKNNIRRGFRMLIFSIARLFVETWIVQAIWNNVVTDITTATGVSYWQAFALMIFIRILTGQFKISFSATKENPNVKN